MQQKWSNKSNKVNENTKSSGLSINGGSAQHGNESLHLSCTSCLIQRLCITSESVCMRCICPPNEINEIMSVPKRVLTVIKPGGCGWLDELIDRSVEDAARGILMQEKCQRRDVCWKGIHCHHATVTEGFIRIKNSNTKSNELLSPSDCVLNQSGVEETCQETTAAAE